MIGLAISAAALVGFLVGLFVGAVYGAGLIVRRIRELRASIDRPGDAGAARATWLAVLDALLRYLSGGQP